jgi:hypothetical protein
MTGRQGRWNEENHLFLLLSVCYFNVRNREGPVPDLYDRKETRSGGAVPSPDKKGRKLQ